MSALLYQMIRLAGILFAILLLCFTGYQTWSLLYEVSASPVVAVLGLVVFEGGMLYWWFFFQHNAQGLPQLALSLIMAVIGLLLVGGATGIHLGAVEADTFGFETPAKLVTLAVLANLAAKFLMPLISPDTMTAIKTKQAEGKILDEAFKMLDTKSDNMAAGLANAISEDMMGELERKILAGRKRPEIIEGSAYHVARNGDRTPLTAFSPAHLTEPEEKPSLLDRAKSYILNGNGNGHDTAPPAQAELTTPAGPEAEEEPPTRPTNGGRL